MPFKFFNTSWQDSSLQVHDGASLVVPNRGLIYNGTSWIDFLPSVVITAGATTFEEAGFSIDIYSRVFSSTIYGLIAPYTYSWTYTTTTMTGTDFSLQNPTSSAATGRLSVPDGGTGTWSGNLTLTVTDALGSVKSRTISATVAG